MNYGFKVFPGLLQDGKTGTQGDPCSVLKVFIPFLCSGASNSLLSVWVVASGAGERMTGDSGSPV